MEPEGNITLSNNKESNSKYLLRKRKDNNPDNQLLNSNSKKKENIQDEIVSKIIEITNSKEMNKFLNEMKISDSGSKKKFFSFLGEILLVNNFFGEKEIKKIINKCIPFLNSKYVDKQNINKNNSSLKKLIIVSSKSIEYIDKSKEILLRDTPFLRYVVRLNPLNTFTQNKICLNMLNPKIELL